MVRNVLAVAFYSPLQPIFDFAESAHAAKYARRIGHFPARNAALLCLSSAGHSGAHLAPEATLRYRSPVRVKFVPEHQQNCNR
jgi:hypothetical protein